MPRKRPDGVQPRTDQWTQAETQTLLDAQARLTIAQLMDLLPGRSHTAISKRCTRMGIAWLKRAAPIDTSIRTDQWTPEETQILWDANGTLSIYELSRVLPRRTQAAIRHQVAVLNIPFKKTFVRHPSYKQKAPTPSPYKVLTDTRRCLTCGAKFESWGAGNRLCQTHRHGDGTPW